MGTSLDPNIEANGSVYINAKIDATADDSNTKPSRCHWSPALFCLASMMLQHTAPRPFCAVAHIGKALLHRKYLAAFTKHTTARRLLKQEDKALSLTQLGATSEQLNHLGRYALERFVSFMSILIMTAFWVALCL